MRFVHYSAAPVLKVTSVEQIPADRGTYSKPNGFWVSAETEGCDDDWRDWCLSESFGLNKLTHVHEVAFTDKADLLILKGPYGIDQFSRKYRCSDERWSGIDWQRVATRYQGIIIAPYVWARRLDGDASWYYGWDCASGCVWDAAAVASIQLVEVVPVPVPEAETTA